MRKCVKKRFLAVTLAASMSISFMPLQNGTVNALEQKVREAQVEVPEPYYEFTFDNEIANGKVENEGAKKGITASIDGTGNELGVVSDEERGNK
ncbi:MAG: hypothetical protein K2L07_07025, partial [Lachnospiraceae bacterium]|nr:hypothetical protein [Lachnospiraceae bacterium]